MPSAAGALNLQGNEIVQKHDVAMGRAGERKRAKDAGSAFLFVPRHDHPDSATSPLTLESDTRTATYVRNKGDDLHNTWKDGNEHAQARQAANYATATSSAINGWWTDMSKNKKNSGLNTSRVFHTKKHNQISFVESEVKPHHKHILEGVSKEFVWENTCTQPATSYSSNAASPFAASRGGRGGGEVSSEFFMTSPTSSRINSMPTSPAIKLCPQKREMVPGMTSRERVQALDWKCWGQRNHITILRKQDFDTQYGTAAAHNARLSSRADTSFPRVVTAAPGQIVSLRDLANSSKRAQSSLGHSVSVDSFVRGDEIQVVSDEAQRKREFLNLGRGSNRSGW
eukprot:CAMPEP_0179414506 /NCGR_PEP_ID=MMETSP0799-20121207/5705_1 /TAXON_ID=46947 /ORGANISM="Geminigera cryophila, Strain CCMP2564" /LENGTH=340 /DNA_ID=CAMNT_0021187123 /DNA_START=8 /DNA_END=1027 /DNA_ORIENTATION=+